MILLALACTGPDDEVIVPHACAGTWQKDTLDDRARTVDAFVDDPAAGFQVHIQLRWPDAAPKANQKWPMALVIHGGWDQQGTPVQRGAARIDPAEGVVEAHLDLPGNGLTTGESDRRGANSRKAVATALRWMAGQDADTEGCTAALRTTGGNGDDLYLVGTSNGGNLVTAVLADATLDVPPMHGAVLWENPPGPQFANVDFGRDPSVYVPDSCEFAPATGITCPVPDDRLAWNLPDTGPIEPCFDVDRNGRCGAADVDIHGAQDPPTGLMMITPSLVTALEAAGADMTGYADSVTAATWWTDRDSGQHATRLVELWPDLPILLLGSEEDHIQSLIDHPHIHGMGEAFQSAQAAWTRLNPGRSWLPGLAVENPPNLPLSLRGDAAVLLPEENEYPLERAIAAAVLELAYRHERDEWGD